MYAVQVNGSMLRLTPLGGLGRIGGNMFVYETAEDLVVVDCGVVFPTADEPGVDYVIPDVSYLRERADKLRAYVITHGHEDHIGALPYVLSGLPAPIYATRFTLGLLRTKFREFPSLSPELREMRDHEPFTVGSFSVEPIPVTHSIPGAVALALRTPIGLVVHTGDFKLDPSPLDGRLTAVEALQRLGDEGVALLLSDSTNAERPGHTWSERDVQDTLDPLIREAPYRVIVTTFSSNLHRLQMIIEASTRAGRKVVAIGRSMQQIIQMALENGFLSVPRGSLVDIAQAERLPRHRVCVIAAGCQGEPRSAMARIGSGQSSQVPVEPGDRVILSSRRIPGNERAVGTMVNRFCRLGAEVIDDRRARVHTSGHGFNDEQRRMLELCRPQLFAPLHGELRHLIRHAALAREAGLDEARVWVIEDGIPLEITRAGADAPPQACRGAPVRVGYAFVDGKGVGDVGEHVLRDRRTLAQNGIVICLVVTTRDGRILLGPEIVTRGVVHVDESHELLRRAAEQAREALLDPLDPAAGDDERAEKIRVALRRFFRRELERRPLVVAVVLPSRH